MSSRILVDEIQDASGNNQVKPSGLAIQLDGWRLSSDEGTDDQNPIGGSGEWERIDEATFSKIGTGLTESNGIFTFPSTGVWWIDFVFNASHQNSTANVEIIAMISTDTGSNFEDYTTVGGSISHNSGAMRKTFPGHMCINVTNASTFQFKFKTNGFNSNDKVEGNSAKNLTYFFCRRIADAQT